MRCYASVGQKKPLSSAIPTIFVEYSVLQKGSFWLILLSLTYLCAACNSSEAKSSKDDKGKKRPVAVVVANATQKTIPMLVQATGTVEAYSTVSVKSQVGGQLTGVYFQQGQNVKKGDLLFKIDSRTLQAALMQANAAKAKDVAQVQQAKANVAKAIAQVSQAKANVEKARATVNQAKANVVKDVAQATNADIQAQRYATLVKQGAISKQQAEQYQTSSDAQRATVKADQDAVVNAQAAVTAAQADLQNYQAAVTAAQAGVENAQAAVAADQAAIDNAKVQLSYSSIYSPTAGRTGSLKLNQGNLVQANSTDPLVTISQIHPVYVTFSIPQRLLGDLKKYSANNKLEVEALPPKDAGNPVRGQLTFVDSGVNTQTGTIQLKGTFVNTEERLSPGQFVNVVLKLSETPNAITVPAQAVQAGQKGQFVYVVQADKKVEVRPVTVGDSVENQTVIKEGLKPGEQVVIDGQFNLVPGAIAQIKDAVGNKK